MFKEHKILITVAIQLRTFASVIAVVAAIAGGSAGVRADDLDSWCAQVKKASSIVICSDSYLREQVIARNRLFEAARAQLSPDAYRKLNDDQSLWIRSYTAACGVSVEDPPPQLPIPQTVIDCYRQASEARTAYLTAYLSQSNPSTTTPNIPASEALTSGSGTSWRCRDPNTNFVYTRPEPCAKGDRVLSRNESLDAISLVEANGVYKVPVLINGVLPLQFVLDSGAADVSIPEDVFSVLERIGTIRDDDYIGTGSYQLADGSVVQSDRFYIRELRLGTRVLNDVSASIGGKTSSLLLGQSFLKRFASVQVDNTRHVLVLGSDLSGANGRAGLPQPPAGFTPDQPLRFDPPTRRYAVIPPPSSSPMPSDSPTKRSIAAPPPPINLGKIKISEVVRPFGWISPETVQFIISNASDQRVSEITIGNAQAPGACSRSLSDYQSFKKFVVNLSPGDSLQVEGKFSSGEYFCIISAE